LKRRAVSRSRGRGQQGRNNKKTPRIISFELKTIMPGFFYVLCVIRKPLLIISNPPRLRVAKSFYIIFKFFIVYASNNFAG